MDDCLMTNTHYSYRLRIDESVILQSDNRDAIVN